MRVLQGWRYLVRYFVNVLCLNERDKNRSDEPEIYFAFIALLLSLIGFYLVRGMFEQVDLKPLGILLGFLIAMMGHSSTKQRECAMNNLITNKYLLNEGANASNTSLPCLDVIYGSG